MKLKAWSLKESVLQLLSQNIEDAVIHDSHNRGKMRSRFFWTKSEKGNGMLLLVLDSFRRQWISNSLTPGMVKFYIRWSTNNLIIPYK
jgi:hypothetical protein